jgi:hypothetical protein
MWVLGPLLPLLDCFPHLRLLDMRGVTPWEKEPEPLPCLCRPSAMTMLQWLSEGLCDLLVGPEEEEEEEELVERDRGTGHGAAAGVQMRTRTGAGGAERSGSGSGEVRRSLRLLKRSGGDLNGLQEGLAVTTTATTTTTTGTCSSSGDATAAPELAEPAVAGGDPQSAADGDEDDPYGLSGRGTRPHGAVTLAMIRFLIEGKKALEGRAKWQPGPEPGGHEGLDQGEEGRMGRGSEGEADRKLHGNGAWDGLEAWCRPSSGGQHGPGPWLLLKEEREGEEEEEELVEGAGVEQ